MTITALEQPQITGKWEAAMLAGSDPIAVYWAMFLAHNQNEALEDDYIAAFDNMHAYAAPTCEAVVRKFVAMYSDGGCPNTDHQEALIAQAKHVLETEA